MALTLALALTLSSASLASSIVRPWEPRPMPPHPGVVIHLGGEVRPAAEAGTERVQLPTRLISVELERTDVRLALQQLADVGDVQIVIGDDVSGSVTLRLDRVAWDDAFNAVLATQGLAMRPMAPDLFLIGR